MNWDSWWMQPLFNEEGECIGRLMPRATMLELGYGIQGWSRPEQETRALAEPYPWSTYRRWEVA